MPNTDTDDPNRSSWDLSATDILSPLITRRMVRTPAVTILRVDFKKGATMALHHHVHEQITLVESGLMMLDVAGKEVILKPGDILRVPPDVSHYTEALADSTTVEIFSPAREDIPCPEYACLTD
jgi:quercetin dioxygenase-like cupin family protein